MNSTFRERNIVVAIAAGGLVTWFYGLATVGDNNAAVLVGVFMFLASYGFARPMFRITQNLGKKLYRQAGISESSCLVEQVFAQGTLLFIFYMLIPERVLVTYICFILAPMWIALAVHIKEDVFND